jgi:hypothetical protein
MSIAEARAQGKWMKNDEQKKGDAMLASRTCHIPLQKLKNVSIRIQIT